MELERLQKILASSGVASRRRCEELIADGAVKVNGKIAHLGDKADRFKDVIEVEGYGTLERKSQKLIYIMLNKPRGYVTTVKDELDRKKVMELVGDIKERIFPVGRLDRDTEGLLLMTNDGDLANRLIHPRFMIDKVYLAWTDPLPDFKGLQYLREGICLEDGWTKPAQADIIETTEGKKIVRIVIHEGRNREVRRMLDAIGCKVKLLRRTEVGMIKLGNLKTGRYRHLTKSEVQSLLRS